MILNSQRTMYGIHLGMNLMLGLDHTDLPNTTLNEKFNILPQQTIPSGVYPKANYFTIGIGGSGITSASAYKFSKHRAMDGALFDHIPFIVRPVISDLSGTERDKYRLRVVETHNSVSYACYYGKVVPNIINRNTLSEITTTVGGLTSIKEITSNDPSILSPIPRVIDNYLDTTQTQFMTKTTKLEFSLYIAELAEVRDAMLITRGVVSDLTEIGIVAGIDTGVAGSKEITNAILVYFAEINIIDQVFLASDQDYIRNIEIGGAEVVLR